LWNLKILKHVLPSLDPILISLDGRSRLQVANDGQDIVIVKVGGTGLPSAV
jgi:hypothetical protein